MTLGNPFFAKGDVALRTSKRRIFLLLIDLEIQSSTVVGGGSGVTSVRAAARTHRNLECFQIQRIEGRTRHVMTTHAVQIRMLAAFMPESAGGNAAAPMIVVALAAVAAFDEFSPDNDPWQEHDMAFLDVDGERIPGRFPNRRRAQFRSRRCDR